MNDHQIGSELIEQIATLAVAAGNAVKFISSDWKPKQVVFMDRPLSAATREEIVEQFPVLEPFASEATPHNPATDGFIDRTTDVVIAFPAPDEQRRWF